MVMPKPLLGWRWRTLVEHQIETLYDGGADEVIVVLGHRAKDIQPRVWRAGGRIVVNERYADGRSSSILAGLAALRDDTEHILLLGVDQPRTANVVARVIEAHLNADALLTSPRHEGRGGHPLMFSARLLPELLQISERHQGLREVFERHRAEITEVHFDAPIVRLDFNTPAEYVAALKKYARTAAAPQ